MNRERQCQKKLFLVDGVKRHGENVSVKEDFGGESEFMRHPRVDDQTRSVAGKTYDGKIALVSRKSDGDHVKYTSNVITKPSNLVKAMRRGLSFKKLKKGRNSRKHSAKQGKQATKRGKSARRQGSRSGKRGKHSGKKGKSARRQWKNLQKVEEDQK